MTRANFGIVVVVATGFLSCADPVLSDAVDALGPETSGIPKASTTVQDSRAVHATKKEDLPRRLRSLWRERSSRRSAGRLG